MILLYIGFFCFLDFIFGGREVGFDGGVGLGGGVFFIFVIDGEFFDLNICVLRCIILLVIDLFCFLFFFLDDIFDVFGISFFLLLGVERFGFFDMGGFLLIFFVKLGFFDKVGFVGVNFWGFGFLGLGFGGVLRFFLFFLVLNLFNIFDSLGEELGMNVVFLGRIFFLFIVFFGELRIVVVGFLWIGFECEGGLDLSWILFFVICGFLLFDLNFLRMMFSWFGGSCFMLLVGFFLDILNVFDSMFNYLEFYYI